MNREAIQKVLNALEPEPFWADWYLEGVVIPRAIEILKQALAEPEQEPVAWPHKWGCRANAFGECNMGCTRPQAREPLTEQEIQTIWAKTFEMGSSANTFARAIEKAHGIKEQEHE